MDIKLVVGLGNPGAQYEGTRHNCGFMVIDRLAQRWGLSLMAERRFRGYFGEGTGPRGKLRLLKPETFMNRSGESVRAVLDWYKLEPDTVLVIYDDIALSLGRLRLRAQGSAGGHNGVKSLIQHLGTEVFPRIRFGVGQPQGQRSMVKHVLGRFAPEEKDCLEKVIDVASDAVEVCLRQDFQTAMNRFNPLQICPEDPTPLNP